MNSCKAFIKGDRIGLKIPYKYRNMAKKIPTYRWNSKKKIWTYNLSPLLAYKITKLNLEVETTEGFNELVKTAKQVKKAQKLKGKEGLPEIPNTKYPAWTHQKQAYHFAKNLHSTMLAMDMGTGKTKVAIDLIVNRKHSKTLVVCPLSAISVWPKEIEKHTKGNISIRSIPLNAGSTENRMEYMNLELRKAEAKNQQAVVILNYDIIYRDNVKKELDKVVPLHETLHDLNQKKGDIDLGEKDLSSRFEQNLTTDFENGKAIELDKYKIKKSGIRIGSHAVELTDI